MTRVLCWILGYNGKTHFVDFYLKTHVSFWELENKNTPTFSQNILPQLVLFMIYHALLYNYNHVHCQTCKTEDREAIRNSSVIARSLLFWFRIIIYVLLMCPKPCIFEKLWHETHVLMSRECGIGSAHLTANSQTKILYASGWYNYIQPKHFN